MSKYQIILKVILFITIFFFLGGTISFTISYLERNITLDSLVEYLLTKNKEQIQDKTILSSITSDIDLLEFKDNNYGYLGVPVRIELPTVGINLEIQQGEYDYKNQTWSLSNGFAYWANLSDPIHTKDSSTVIYAHNQIDEFYKTKNLNKNDEIIITTNEGKTVKFKYIEDRIVTPENSDVLFENAKESQLILITCSGLFSEKRRVMYAQIVKEETSISKLPTSLDRYMEKKSSLITKDFNFPLLQNTNEGVR